MRKSDALMLLLGAITVTVIGFSLMTGDWVLGVGATLLILTGGGIGWLAHVLIDKLFQK